MKGNKAAADLPKSIFDKAVATQESRHKKLLSNTSGDENPYLIHQELGDVMTRAATVVRDNKQLTDALDKVSQLSDRAAKCGLSDTGSWTNQNVIFTKAVQDMFPVAKCILKGALQRDESRGAHFKPAFSMPSLSATDPAAKRIEAEKWCDAFEENNKKFLKSTICTWNGSDPDVTYEDIDTRLLAPRPRLYGLVGAEVIEQVWNERSAAKAKDSGSKQLVGAT
jgi:succinate dehydrogenase / fumarate reductase flavoprotein subunit